MRKTHGIDLVTAFGDFLRDVKDDFLIDPLLYTDLAAAKDEFRKEIASQMRSRHYYDSNRKHYDELELPKNGKLYRHVVIPHPTERIIFLGFMRKLAPKIDKVLRKSLYSYRVAQRGTANSGIFIRHADQWLAFDKMQDAWINDQSVRVVVETDIANYYEQIGIKRFRCEIEMLSKEGDVDISPLTFDDFEKFLRGLTPYGWYGLPQNHDPSSFFCSAFLHGVDVRMDSKYRYIRYVDDIRIATNNFSEAKRALCDLSRDLRQYRLFLNSAKTVIHERKNGGFDKLRQYEDEAQAIRANFGKCTKSSLKEGYRQLQSLVGNLLASKRTDERKLRFCLNRFVELKSYRNIRIKKARTIKERFYSSLNDYPVRLEHFIRYLAEFHDDGNTVTEVTDLIKDEGKVHYDWVRMWLWEYVIRSKKKKNIPNVTIQTARERFFKLIDSTGQEYAELAKVVLVLGRYGATADRHLVRDAYDRCYQSQILQRHFLIACRELPSSELKQFLRHVEGKQREHKYLCKYLLDAPRVENGYTAFKRVEKAKIAKDGAVRLISTVYALEDY